MSFSTWLPSSQETLTSYLLADIASECKAQYIVPGLRQSTRRFATALGQRVPLLSDYLKLVPTTTQKDDIENLKTALIRLPKRVVVLLDEIDRMEKDELLPQLLEGNAGLSTLPDLGFVCAGDPTDGQNYPRVYSNNETLVYFEKFFRCLFQSQNQAPRRSKKQAQNE